MKLISKKLFFKSPAPATLVYGWTFYTSVRGVDMVCRRTCQTKSDLFDSSEEAFSTDNGQTWSEFKPLSIVQPRPEGNYRLFIRPTFPDPVTGRLLTISVEGLLFKDRPIEDGLRQYHLHYRVSIDGGRSDIVYEQAIQEGPPGKYDAIHPFDGVTVGKNAMMLGDLGCEPIRTRGGRILVPAQVCPVGPDGEYINPGGGYTYHEAVVLIGRWRDPSPNARDHRIAWTLSDYIKNDPTKSTRGCVEPTIAQFPDGRILMVMRGSNGGSKDPEAKIPGHKWCSVSHDEGSTWEPVRPWTHSDGSPFFSPSSMSQLLPHSNGHIYWLGNISPTNPNANSPRYPLAIGRVDPRTLQLVKESVMAIDDRAPHESPQMTLSNFHAHEDRLTGQIVLHMSRWMLPDFAGDAYVYRVEP